MIQVKIDYLKSQYFYFFFHPKLYPVKPKNMPSVMSPNMPKPCRNVCPRHAILQQKIQFNMVFDMLLAKVFDMIFDMTPDMPFDIKIPDLTRILT